jgi:type IV pilus assembly protein PilQ
MMARRFVTTLALVALVSNLSVFAGTSARAEAQAFALVSLKHETVGSLTRILIESSAPPLYTVFRPTDRLIVVDLPGGEASRLASEYSVKDSLVDLIMVRQSRTTAGSTGRSVARIEVSVRADVHDRSTVDGNTLVLEISPEAKTAAKPAKDTAEPAAAKRVSQPAASGVLVYSAPIAAKNSAPAPEKVVPQPRDLKPATLISAVRSEATDGGVRIIVDTNGTAQFKDFVLPNPWRVVVDITGVRSAFGNKTTDVGAGSVERLRVGQPSSNVVRIVLDTKSKVAYRIVREGASLVITVGGDNTSNERNAKPNLDVKAQQNMKPAKEAAQPAHKREVKVAGERIENKSNDSKPAAQPAKETINTSNLIAQSNTQSSGQRVTPQPNRSLPLPTQPVTQPGSPKSVAQPAPSSANRSVMDVQRTPNGQSQMQKRSDLAFCDSGYVGGLISFDLRAGVDLRDMLRFISQQYGVNFIVDKSVSVVPVDIRVTDLPWNQVMESVLRANRLGAVCESNGRMIRIATLAAVKEEEEQQRAILEEKAKQIPLVTKIIHLKYARAAGQLGSTGAGASGRGGGGSSSGGGGGGSSSGAGASGQGSLMSIVNSRLSPRGRIEIDVRTNSLIITDLPEYAQVVEDMISKLDRAEPQVEIEARIVIANRNFLRDIGSELAGGALGKKGRSGIFETTPVQFTGGGLSSGGGSGGASSGSSSDSKGLGPNLVGPFADTSLRAGVANTVLSLTTGALGTGILSAALSASETKGQIRTIASPRVTTTDNKTAEIVNGVQIPVQTVSNNTITTTFVTAALRLEITPQIIEENGQVLMHVVAENNSVNFSLANQFNNGTPGIDTQSAESTVLVGDGGTTVMGGINIDSEGSTINRTPGISRIPLLGELFKHRSTRREDREILFFLTPRIVRNDGTLGPRAPQRSSVEGTPNPVGPQRAAVAPAPAAPAVQEKKQEPKPVQAAPPTTGAGSGKGGQ